jgi:hypothetical protein
MSCITPTGGTRRSHFQFQSGGVLFDPAQLDIKVYVDGSATANATLSDEATDSLTNIGVGVYHYQYSVAGFAGGTHLRDVISAKLLLNSSLDPYSQSDTMITGIVASPQPLGVTDSVTLRISGDCC